MVRRMCWGSRSNISFDFKTVGLSRPNLASICETTLSRKSKVGFCQSAWFATSENLACTVGKNSRCKKKKQAHDEARDE